MSLLCHPHPSSLLSFGVFRIGCVHTQTGCSSPQLKQTRGNGYVGGSITQTSVIEWVAGPFVFLPMAAFDFHFHSGGSTVVEQDSGECSNEAHSFPDVEGTGRPEKNIAHKFGSQASQFLTFDSFIFPENPCSPY